MPRGAGSLSFHDAAIGEMLAVIPPKRYGTGQFDLRGTLPAVAR